MTIAAYRKLGANKGKLEKYYKSIDDVPTQTDFIRTLTIEQRAAKEVEREKKLIDGRKQGRHWDKYRHG